jgi:hypothetical protein
MTLYEEIIETALEDFDLAGLRILDAGSGQVSARALIGRTPRHLICVCAPQDRQKLDATFNELGGKREDADVIGADLSKPHLFPNKSFDFILADHLVGEIDIFAPGKHIDVLTSLFDYLVPHGNLVVIDTEPDHPSSISAIFPNGQEMDPGNIKIDSMDNPTIYRVYSTTRWFLYEIALNKGIRGFMKIPGDWVEKWLMGIGFVKIHPQLATRIIEIDVDPDEEKRWRMFLNLVGDEKLRKYLEALLDRTEGFLREVCPFDIEQDIYIISAGKE